MSDQQVHDEIVTILIAGTETTAVALAWFFRELGQHPEVQRRFHAEIDHVLAGRMATLDDIPRLEYTRRIISEVLRKYPILILMRRARTDVDLGGVHIQPGTEVALSQYTLHHDPHLYPDPARFGDVTTRKTVGDPLMLDKYNSKDLAFSSDGTLLAAAGFDRTVRLWNVATRSTVGDPLPHPDAVSAVAFSPNGRLLASAGGNEIQLWDVATRRLVGDPLKGHADVVNAVAFSADGRLLASAGKDRTVRLWDTATRQPFAEPLTGHVDSVEAVAFSPDGTLLATGSRDSTIRLWATPRTWTNDACEIASRNLSQDEWDRYVGHATPYLRHCARYPSGPGAYLKRRGLS